VDEDVEEDGAVAVVAAEVVETARAIPALGSLRQPHKLSRTLWVLWTQRVRWQ